VPVTETKPPAADEPFILALRSFWDGKHQEALEHLRHYDPANQEALICLTAIVARLTKAKLSELSPQEVAALQEQLQRKLLALPRPGAELLIDKICFCRRITGYEDYEPLAPDHEFQPMESVWLYVDLRNLTSTKRDGGVYETYLQSSMRILDQTGMVVDERTADRESPSRTWKPRPDYFKHYHFFLPANLPPDVYTLEIAITDLNRPNPPRTATKTLQFRVAAGASGS
jgi:hypothetical protein